MASWVVAPSLRWILAGRRAGLLLALALLAAALSQGCAARALPRIGVVPGQGRIGGFVEAPSGRLFTPSGFNHTVLGPPHTHHVTFNVGQYDQDKMEAALAGMERAGANTVRVWAWGDIAEGRGVTGALHSRGVNPAYMDNFIDFLRRCRRHKIYVVAVLDEPPLNQGYADIADRLRAQGAAGSSTGYNTQFLSQPLIAAKAALIRDFIGAVKARDASLLSTVLAWSLQNEVFVYDNAGPFDRHEGLATVANGKAYDLSRDDQRQACWDESVVYWANELTRAVKDVDPAALVTAGMFTSDAEGRLPVSGINQPRADARYPPRPSVLAAPACRLDFIDIHVYPFTGAAAVNLATNEYEALRQQGKPVLCGEYGIFRELTKPEQAAAQERELRRNIQALGYAGPLLWIWDLIPNSNTYTAAELGLCQTASPGADRP